MHDSAMPPDVRKRAALPFRLIMNSGLRPNKLGRAQKFKWQTSRKAKGLPHIRRHSRRLLVEGIQSSQTNSLGYNLGHYHQNESPRTPFTRIEISLICLPIFKSLHFVSEDDPPRSKYLQSKYRDDEVDKNYERQNRLLRLPKLFPRICRPIGFSISNG